MNLKRTHFPFKNDFNLIFENALKGYNDESFVDTGTWEPAVDIKEEQERFLVIADIPGVRQEDIHIALENSLLTIHGERIIEKKDDKQNYSRTERVQGKFYRRFSLPQTADESHITAKYKQGVLEISIPKKDVAVQRKISISSED